MVVADADDLDTVAVRRPGHLCPKLRHSPLHLHAFLALICWR